MEEGKRIIEISIKPVDIDYKLIFSDKKLFDERRKILLNAYILYLTWGKYEIAEEFKSLITDLELSKEMYVENINSKTNDVIDKIPEMKNESTSENIE